MDCTTKELSTGRIQSGGNDYPIAMVKKRFLLGGNSERRAKGTLSI
jgi:hypothetical protein